MGLVSIVSPQLSVTAARLQNSSSTPPVQVTISENNESQPEKSSDTQADGLLERQQILLLENPGGVLSNNPNQLTPEEQEIVRELKQIDQQVRAHERQHAIIGGQYAGQPSFTTVTGPDGAQYAVAGSVPIDTAPVPNDPEATIQKLETVIRAALAPAQPSPQDRRVAAQARAEIIQAQAELRRQSQEELLSQQEESTEGSSSTPLETAIEAYSVIARLSEESDSSVGSFA